MKLPRLLAVWFLVLGTSIFCLPFANAENTGQITVTCGNEAGESRVFNVGWDTTTQFFEGKGNIAALFCSIATQGKWKTFVSTTAPESTWYYNGVAPTPEPTPEPLPSPSPEPTPTPSPEPSVEPSPTPTVETPTVTSPVPDVTLTPVSSDTSTVVSNASPTPISLPDTSTATPVLPEQPITPEPQPTPLPEPMPVPPAVQVPAVPIEPVPVPVQEPAPVQPDPVPEPPVAVPLPEPSPEPAPEPAPVPVEPSPVEPSAPEPAPEPVPVEPEPPVLAPEPPVVAPEHPPEAIPAPVIPAPAPVPAPEPPVVAPAPPPVATVNSTPEQRAAIAETLIESAQGAPVTAQAIAAAGLEYKDLPAETPVEVREDEDGNEVVITAEVAAALVVLENPAELLNAILTDPTQALLALTNIGADMSVEEREESEKIIIASVIAGQAAVGAAGMAAAYRRNP